LIVHAVVRARFCETLAEAGGIARPGDAFLVGLFSLLDALVDCPLLELLSHVHLPETISAALLGMETRSGLSLVYQMALRYEAAEWDEFERLAEKMHIPGRVASALYVDALSWANGMLNITAPGRPKNSGEDLLALHGALGESGTSKTETKSLAGSRTGH
jgi:EAL and modified HD-GYP domain-containing signal transduction protein